MSFDDFAPRRIILYFWGRFDAIFFKYFGDSGFEEVDAKVLRVSQISDTIF